MFQRGAFLPPAPSSTAKDQRSTSDDATPLLCFCSGAEKPAPRLPGARPLEQRHPHSPALPPLGPLARRDELKPRAGSGNVMY